MAVYSNTDLKNGTVFRDDGEVYTVIKYEHNFRGRGSGVVKVRVRNVRNGNVVEKSYRQNQTVEAVDTHKANVQYIFQDGNTASFMDAQTFEQFTMPLSVLGDGLKYLKEGEKVVALYIDDDPVSIEIPKTVELAISDTVPGVKGDSANNPTKKATLENGLEIDVPLFAKVGDVVKINTESGDYLGRV